MPETAVLANLSIDSSGVVTGIKQSNAALGSGDAALVRFGGSQKALAGTTDLIVGKMFSFRAASLALARSLGIVGVVLALAAALKTLITDLITSTTWFKKAKEAVTDWYNALVKGETALDALTRKQIESNKAAGVKSIFDQIEALKKLKLAREEASGRLTTLGAAPPAIGTAPQGMEGPLGPMVAGWLGLSAATAESVAKIVASTDFMKKAVGLDLEAYQRSINETIKELEGWGFTSAEIAKQFGLVFKEVPLTPNQIAEAAKKAAEELEKALGVAVEFTQIVDVLGQRRLKLFDLAGILPPEQLEARIVAIGDALLALDSTAVNFSVGVDNLAQEMIGLGFTADEVKQKFLDLGVVWENIKPPDSSAWDDFVDGMISVLETGQAQFEIFQAAAQHAASAVTKALTGGAVSGKQAIASLLADLSRMLIVYALMFLAAGIAASTGYGAAVLAGTPAQFFKAAAVFGAAGVAAGLASRALGGPEGSSAESSSGGGGGRGGRNRGGDTTSNQTITVVVQGSVEDPNAFARKIAALINTNRADGARA